MMDSFEDTPECNAIWRLAALRRENLAVQLGHYKTLWLSEDVLVYTAQNPISASGNDQGFPGYGSQWDQMAYRDINVASASTVIEEPVAAWIPK